jgi:hypothetical protein
LIVFVQDSALVRGGREYAPDFEIACIRDAVFLKLLIIHAILDRE